MNAKSTIYSDNDLEMPTIIGSLVMASTSDSLTKDNSRRLFKLVRLENLPRHDKEVETFGVWIDQAKLEFTARMLIDPVILYRGETVNGQRELGGI